ncbi:hypothetical protein [Spirochaeta africana]|uniref:HEAT repeat domain-containing protein n=1 Tax=Spirochaeta africana (strain ATCC 700263 / DSM 8902 / Z-7692) TaxID=889378 RepID=H9UIF7_SPIAZ|nr:hypothetical protein [Spirochaeta africana]AFG37300.1 hypothetical protein Spiaf_1222 [Spirochaeta africana DSM 8902]
MRGRKNHAVSDRFLRRAAAAVLLAFLPVVVLPAQQHPDWIPARPGSEQVPEKESNLSPSARAVLSVQAASPDIAVQRDAVHGIRELIERGSIQPDDPGAVELLYEIAAQSFLRTEIPSTDRTAVRIEAIRTLAGAGPAARLQLLSILQRDPDPTAAAEAAYALSGQPVGWEHHDMLARRLRRSRSPAPDDRLAHALLQLALEELDRGMLGDQLIEEIIRTYSGPFVREVRILAARILQIISEE